MTRRLVGLGLLLAAAAIHAGVTLPARRARDGRASVRAASARSASGCAPRSRGWSAARPAAPRAPAGDAAAARALRLSLLSATRGLALGESRSRPSPERRGAIAARGRLVAAGSQADLLRAAGRLAEPASGLGLERVQLIARPERPRLEAETVSLRAGS